MTNRTPNLLSVGYVISVFAVSLTATVAAGYFFVARTAGERLAVAELLSGDFIGPLVAIAAAITLGVCGLSHFIDETIRQRQDQSETAAANTPPSPAKQSSGPPPTSHLLRLKRSAERLHVVEDDLIRRLADVDMDRPTLDLITQMQICTSRLIRQIADVSEDNTSDTSKNIETRGRERHGLLQSEPVGNRG